jgi:hypothetical protein
MAIRLKAFIEKRAQSSIQITYEVADATEVLLRPASFDSTSRSPSLGLGLGNAAFSETVRAVIVGRGLLSSILMSVSCQVHGPGSGHAFLGSKKSRTLKSTLDVVRCRRRRLASWKG